MIGSRPSIKSLREHFRNEHLKIIFKHRSDSSKQIATYCWINSPWHLQEFCVFDQNIDSRRSVNVREQIAKQNITGMADIVQKLIRVPQLEAAKWFPWNCDSSKSAKLIRFSAITYIAIISSLNEIRWLMRDRSRHNDSLKYLWVSRYNCCNPRHTSLPNWIIYQSQIYC